MIDRKTEVVFNFEPGWDQQGEAACFRILRNGEVVIFLHGNKTEGVVLTKKEVSLLRHALKFTDT